MCSASPAWENAAVSRQVTATDAAPTSTEDKTLRFHRVLLAALCLFGLFFYLEHDRSFAGMQVTDVSEEKIKDKYVDEIEQGDTARKLLLIAFAFWGVSAILSNQERRLNVRTAATTLFLLMFVWALSSFLWAGQPGLTLKRLVVASCVVLGAVGIARSLRPRELLMVALLSLTAFVGTSLLLDLGAGGKPWRGDQRFGGTLHPNIQAAYCGVLCLAAYCQPVGFGRRWITRGLFAFGAAMLYLTQSRTSFLAMLIAIMMVFLLRLSQRVRWATLAGFVSLAAIGVMLYSSLSTGDRTSLTGAVLLGRTEQAGSLTGRVPLWEELATYFVKHPLIGYGYEGFWTPDRIAAVAKSQGWTLQSAHNAFFEVALQLGLIGLVLVLTTTLVSMNLAQKAYDQTRDASYAFLYGLIAFGLVNSPLESHFAKLKYPTVLAIIGMAMIVLYFPRQTDPLPASSPVRDTIDDS